MNIKKYAVIGHPIGHTMSPFIHKRLFKLAGINAEYIKLDISPESLANEYKSTLLQLDGYNITIPHKQSIIPLIDKIDDKAKMYGSVNTVANCGGVATGYTTDPDGFLKALEAENIKIGGRVVILGCGGVARTMAYEVVLKDAPLLFAVRDEDIEVAKALCNEISSAVPNAKADFCKLSELCGDIKLLVNATPVGMYPSIENQPVSDAVINKCESVFDAVYNPLETVLIQKAKANGSNAVGGMSMLVWQAVVAHEKWDGSLYDKSDIAKLCIDSSNELKSK